MLSSFENFSEDIDQKNGRAINISACQDND